MLNECVFTLRQGYLREQELYGFEDMVDGGAELTPFALLLLVHPAILPSLSFAQRDYIHNVVRDRGYRAISLFDMFHIIKKSSKKNVKSTTFHVINVIIMIFINIVI